MNITRTASELLVALGLLGASEATKYFRIRELL
ncbi:MAG: hypothetical protein BWX48_02433 [Verrucomicrobia bacterium ADurb.Bin006]|jgi:hypothetical protein|nr:MAG: hypothetical protein BWX48_02433 [Verrucomicrobia bacterium ADurb.Bin006]